MIILTVMQLLLWLVALSERVDAINKGTRQPSLWSLLLVAVFVCVLMLQLWLEGSTLSNLQLCLRH